MKKIVLIVFFGGVALLSIAVYSQQSQPKRVGMIIGIKPDKISAYEALHAASNQGVRDLLDKYHMNNFSIYIHKMDESHYYLFAYYEYTGNDYKKDMDTMAKEPRNIKWLSVTDAMQIPFAGPDFLDQDAGGVSQSLAGYPQAHSSNDRFQVEITRVSRSKPKVLTEPVPSANRLPARGGRPSQVAARILRTWAWANKATSPPLLHGSIDHLLGSGSDMLDGFALGDGRVPNGPVRLLFANVRGGAAFEDSVVPFTQVLVNLRHIGIAGDTAGFPGTLQRAGQHQAELTMGEVVPNLRRTLLSSRGQRDVGSAGMGAGEAPLRLSVTNQPQLQIHRWRIFLSSRSAGGFSRPPCRVKFWSAIAFCQMRSRESM